MEAFQDALPAEVIRKIVEAVNSIKHGSVVIIVQDSRVIQIDKVEKLRLK